MDLWAKNLIILKDSQTKYNLLLESPLEDFSF